MERSVVRVHMFMQVILVYTKVDVMCVHTHVMLGTDGLRGCYFL
jgi:hypothetical protein